MRQSKQRYFVTIQVAILLLALGIRLAYFNQLLYIYQPDFLKSQPFCGLDANSYHSIYAFGILEGTWPGNQPFAHMILYPFFLAAVYSMVGVSLRLVVMIHILLEVLTCAAIYGVARLTFNKATGLLAALLFAIYAPGIFFIPCFAQVALSVPLFMVTLFLLLKAHAAGQVRYLLIAAVVTGVAALSRPTFFLLIPIVGVWWLLNRVPLKRIILHGALYFVIAFSITLPAAIHNYTTDIEGHFLPTPISGWEIFFLGNNPYAEGMGWLDYVLYVYLEVPGEQYAVDVRALADSTTRDVYRQAALKYIQENPGAWLNLMWRKAYLLLVESDDRLISPYFVHNLQTVQFLRYFPLGWRSVLVAALLGMLFVKHKHRSLLLLIFGVLLAFTLMFHIQYRFRLLFVPLVLLYAAALIVAAPRLGRFPWLATLGILAIVAIFLPELGWLLALFLIASLWPHIDQKNWPRLGWSAVAMWSYLVVAALLIQMVNFTTATQQRQAIFISPTITGPMALGQSFVVHCDGFNRLSLNLGIVGNSPNRQATFHLRADQNSPKDIYSTPVDVAGQADRSWLDITFSAQADSSGHAYFFFVDAPQTPAAEAINLRGTYDQPFNRYREGVAYIGQPGQWQEISGDLAFAAHCDVGPVESINQTFAKLAQRFGSVIFYWVVFIIHFGLLIWALFKLWKLTKLHPLISYIHNPDESELNKKNSGRWHIESGK